MHCLLGALESASGQNGQVTKIQIAPCTDVLKTLTKSSI